MCQPVRKKASIYQHMEMCFSFTGGWRRQNRLGSNSDNVLDVNDLFISSPPLRRQVREPLARQCGEHTSCCLRVASLLARFEFQSTTKRWVSSWKRDASHAATMMSPTLAVNPQEWKLIGHFLVSLRPVWDWPATIKRNTTEGQTSVIRSSSLDMQKSQTFT